MSTWTNPCLSFAPTSTSMKTAAPARGLFDGDSRFGVLSWSGQFSNPRRSWGQTSRSRVLHGAQSRGDCDCDADDGGVECDNSAGGGVLQASKSRIERRQHYWMLTVAIATSAWMVPLEGGLEGAPVVSQLGAGALDAPVGASICACSYGR